MAEEDLVEPRPRHLDGLRRGRFHRGREICILLGSAVEGPEARPPLLHESCGGDRLVDAQGAEDLVTPGKLGFADVESRKPVTLEEEDLAPVPGQRGGGTGTARSSPDDRDIEIPLPSRANDGALRGCRGLIRPRSILPEESPAVKSPPV
jgi:hypothetical protein